MQYAPTLPADGTRWPVKWFLTEANGRRAHVSENISGANERQRPLSDIRVGAYCIRPRCSGPRTIAPDRHPPPLETISGANERHRPLSDIRVGAYCIRPPCSWPRTIAPDRYPPQSENISGANERHRPLSDVRVGAYCIRPQTIRTWNDSVWPRAARKKVSDGSESAFWAPIRFHFISK